MTSVPSQALQIPIGNSFGDEKAAPDNFKSVPILAFCPDKFSEIERRYQRMHGRRRKSGRKDM